MPTFGRYETVRELHRGVRGSVYSARISGAEGAATYSIKTFHPQKVDEGSARAAKEAEAFVDQGRLQQVLSEVEHSNWAAVYSVATSAGEFYRAGALYARSAQDLIAGKVRLSAPQLHAIVSGVINGLMAIQRQARRAHGNLKPSNVLIAGDDLHVSKIGLSDPKPSQALTPANSESGDLADVARLMQALLTHRWAGEHETGDLAAEFARFGKQTAAWQQLHRQLVSAPNDGTVTLETVKTTLGGMAPKTRKPLAWIAVPAAVAACLAAVVLYLVLGRETVDENPVSKSNWSRLLAEYESWFKPFDERASDTTFFAGDAALREIVAGLAEADELNPFEISGSGSRQFNLDRTPSERMSQPVIAALALIDQTRSKLDQWPGLQRIATFAASCTTRGWTSVATQVETIRSAIAPPALDEMVASFEGEKFNTPVPPVIDRHQRDVAGGFEAALQSLALITQIEERLGALEKNTQSFAQAGIDDRVISGFALLAERSALAAATHEPSGESLNKLRDTIVMLDGMANDINKATQRFWKAGDDAPWKADQIDVEWFHRSPVYASLGGAGDLTEANVRAWLTQIQSPDFQRLDPKSDPRHAWKAENNLQQMTEDLVALENDAEIDEMKLRFDSLKEAIAAFEQPLIWSHQTKAEIVSKVAVASERYSNANKLVEERMDEMTADAATYAARLRTTPRRTLSKSPAIESRWQAEAAYWVDQQRSDDKTIREKVRPVETLLEAIDAAADPMNVLPIDAVWSADVQSVAALRRERCLKDMVEKHDLRKLPRVNDAFVRSLKETSEVRDYQQWKADAEKMVPMIAGIEAKLNGLERLKEIKTDGKSISELHTEAQQQSPAVFAELKSAFGSVLKRVDSVIQVEREENIGRLTTLVSNDSDPAVYVSAWRRLGELEAWPADLAQLNDERKFEVNRIAPLSPTRKSLAEEIREQSALRWNRGTERFTSPGDIEAAMGAMKDFELGVEAIRNARTRANFEIVEFRKKVVAAMASPALKKDFDATTTLLADFRNKIKAAGDTATASELLDALKEIEHSFADAPKVQPETMGPGGSAMGWKARRINGEDVVEYTWNAPQGTRKFKNTWPDARKEPSSHTLTFVLVREVENREVENPFYISTTEVPLGLFINTVDASDGWPKMTKLLDLHNKGDWNGPRAWSPPEGDGEPTTIKKNPLWIAKKKWDRDPQYPGNPPPPPNFDQPMQNISADAAAWAARALSCRLPTSSEWQAAYALARGGRTEREYLTYTKANLRDETWIAQQRHVEAVVAKRNADMTTVFNSYPDDGAFWPKDLKPRLEGAKANIPTDGYKDGSLWFRPAAPPSSDFQNLVGNVAEFIFEDAGQMEGATPDEAAQHALKYFQKVRVIGGSALSDRGISLTLPQPIDDVLSRLQPYSDVGFRLAFSAKDAKVVPLAERVHKLLFDPQKNWYVIAQR